MVITGLSGSGKSSLAFDTIYAEGQRRYIETFSAYARQFLGSLERPDVDKIDGVLSGQFKMSMNNQSLILSTGDCLAVPRGVVHSAEVLGSEPVVSLDAVKL